MITVSVGRITPSTSADLAVVGDLEQPPAVRIELALDRAVGVALDPVFEPRVDRVAGRRDQVQVPGAAVLVVAVLDRLLADQRRRVVVRQVDRQHVAVRRLAHQPLLRRDPDAGLRRRVVEPHLARVEQHQLAGVARRIDVAHQVLELARGARRLRPRGFACTPRTTRSRA